MKNNGGLFAGVAVILALLGVSSLPKRSSDSSGAAESGKPAVPPAKQAAKSKKPNEPCEEIAKRLKRFLTASDAARPLDHWRLPDSCYDQAALQTGLPKVQPVSASPDVRFVIATVPNPVSTHLALMFDRNIEAIQQAAQDNHDLYDDSWFPWDTTKDYALLDDQHLADDLLKNQESQPGVMLFRREIPDDQSKPPYEGGLIVFLVGEKPTGGLSDDQFEHALEWVSRLGGLKSEAPLRILGPSFSGSLPSLSRDLEQSNTLNRLDGEKFRVKAHLKVSVSSGMVSSSSGYHWFRTWIQKWQSGSDFWTAIENDFLIADRFCDYLHTHEYHTNQVALLSEDETAYGAGLDYKAEHPCADAITLYYPRDIATLRSAYEQQAILTPAKPQASANTPSTTLHADLSEPANSDHDTVRSYSGQVTPLAQEAVLLDIVNRLKDHRIQFVVLRSTNSLDQIFLTKFLRRAYPEGRVIIDGADLLFTMGAEGKSLRGVMVLSTYPLLTQQLWIPSLLSGHASSRTFGYFAAEGVYIAARNLFPNSRPDIPIPGYAPPAKAASAPHAPATWLSVVGRGQFWPLAALTEDKPAKDKPAKSNLLSSEERGLGSPIPSDPDVLPSLPTFMWMFVLACIVLGVVQFYFCWYGSIVGSPRARTYFAPIAQWQHPVLVSLGCLLIAMLAVAVAGGSGLFSSNLGRQFWGPWDGPLLAVLVSISFALPFLACIASFRLKPLFTSGSTEPRMPVWRLGAGLAALCVLSVFALDRIYLVSKLQAENLAFTYWRVVNLWSGVSPLLPEVLLIGGAYLWCWCNLRGLAHFGEDRPLLPPVTSLPAFEDGSSRMPMFTQDRAGTRVEDVARPLSKAYLLRLVVLIGITVAVCAVALQDFQVRTLGDRVFGSLIFNWICILIAVILADAIQAWRAWSELRQLLVSLDRLTLRRTLRAMKGLSWGSIWKMSGGALEERYRVISLQIESLRRLKNALDESSCATDTANVMKDLDLYDDRIQDFAKWYVKLDRDKPVPDLTKLREFQEHIACTAGMVLTNILMPAWKLESDSLICECAGPDGKPKAEDHGGVAIPSERIPLYVRAAEEFFVLPYLAFIQNVLGRIRTIAWGIIWLFLGATLAVSSYPFDPLTVLGAIFLSAFVVVGGLMCLVYSQMSRDATLSHLTNTRPGELGWDFWVRIVTFGVGPLIGLLTTLFPSITDFVFSWLQPGVQSLK